MAGTLSADPTHARYRGYGLVHISHPLAGLTRHLRALRVPDAIDVECSTCGAAAGERCKTQGVLAGAGFGHHVARCALMRGGDCCR